MNTGRGAAYALLGLSGLLFAIALGSGWSGASRLAARSDESAAVAEAASAFVVAYGSFDFRDPGGYIPRLAALTAGELHDAVTRAVVDPQAIAGQRAATATVDAASVTALSDVAGTVSVRSTHRRSWLEPSSGALIHEQLVQTVSLRLVREGGRWLVAELAVTSQEPLERNGVR